MLSTARMNRILEIRPQDFLAVVQPGVTNLGITRAVEADGFYYAPDPSSQIACTIAPEVKAWLDTADLDWRAQLSNRIGMRWTLDAAPGPRDKIDARAL